MASYIAINLKDFHDKSKQWQGGKIKSVEIKVIGADNLEKAEKQYEDLHEKAVRRYLDKTDFNVSDWLTKAEWKIFEKLA